MDIADDSKIIGVRRRERTSAQSYVLYSNVRIIHNSIKMYSAAVDVDLISLQLCN